MIFNKAAGVTEKLQEPHFGETGKRKKHRETEKLKLQN